MPTVSESQVSTPDGPMALYEAVPDGAPKGAVVVLQEAFGVNDHIEDVTRRFADAGYRAVAPHLFHRSGDPRLGYDDMPAAFEHLGKLSLDGMEADLDATLDHLRDTGFDDADVATVGFCMGGSVSFLAGRRTPLGASVTFYGGGIAEGRFGAPPLLQQAAGLETPWLGFYGDEDTGIPTDEVENLRAAAATAAVPTAVVRYADAGHGFHCDAREAYAPEAAKDAWEKTLAFLGDHLG